MARESEELIEGSSYSCADAVSELDYILDSMLDDVLITDGQGVIKRFSKSFETMYGIEGKKTLGRTVYELEREGVFRPSITAIVLKTGERTTLGQKNSVGRDIVVTAIPIKDDAGKIIKVISFSRDITEYLELQKQYQRLEAEVEAYSEEISKLRSQYDNASGMVAESREMQRILQLALKVAKYNTNILITGESGVGKTMLARFIHDQGMRSSEKFIELNCGAIPANLLESELFGYEAGAFTGASKRGKIGLIELADKGTLFLDEISELTLDLQVKLLKVLQDKKFVRVGGTEPIYSDFRLITASNKPLARQVEDHYFREDLYYRINVVNIEIPPLRDRKEDTVVLIRNILDQMNQKYDESKRLSPAVFHRLLDHSWPGNIRELENTIERMIITADREEIGLDSLPSEVSCQPDHVSSSHTPAAGSPQAEDEKKRILKAYEKHKTSAGVARELGISQPTAYRKIKKYLSE